MKWNVSGMRVCACEWVSSSLTHKNESKRVIVKRAWIRFWSKQVKWKRTRNWRGQHLIQQQLLIIQKTAAPSLLPITLHFVFSSISLPLFLPQVSSHSLPLLLFLRQTNTSCWNMMIQDEKMLMPEWIIYCTLLLTNTIIIISVSLSIIFSLLFRPLSPSTLSILSLSLFLFLSLSFSLSFSFSLSLSLRLISNFIFWEVLVQNWCNTTNSSEKLFQTERLRVSGLGKSFCQHIGQYLFFRFSSLTGKRRRWKCV